MKILFETGVRIYEMNNMKSNAGLSTEVTSHMFRYSVATYLIKEGADISQVQKILGHSSIKTTQIYIYVAAKMQAEVLRMFHPRNKMDFQLGAE